MKNWKEKFREKYVGIEGYGLVTREGSCGDIIQDVEDFISETIALEMKKVEWKPLIVNELGKCMCVRCEGKYIQVDPVGCGCTECITRQYRPAINEEDYDRHNGEEATTTPITS